MKEAWEACELCSVKVRWETGRQSAHSPGDPYSSYHGGSPQGALLCKETEQSTRPRAGRGRGGAEALHRGVDVTSNSAATSTGHTSRHNSPIPLSISRTWVSLHYPALSLAPDGIFTAIEPKWSVFPRVPVRQGLGTESRWRFRIICTF